MKPQTYHGIPIVFSDALPPVPTAKWRLYPIPTPAVFAGADLIGRKVVRQDNGTYRLATPEEVEAKTYDAEIIP